MRKLSILAITIFLFAASICNADDKTEKHPGQKLIEKFFKLASESKTEDAMKLAGQKIETRIAVSIGKLSDRKGMKIEKIWADDFRAFAVTPLVDISKSNSNKMRHLVFSATKAENKWKIATFSVESDERWKKTLKQIKQRHPKAKLVFDATEKKK